MKHRTKVLGLLAVCTLLLAGCSGSGSGGISTVNVNTLDGSTGVPVNAKFQYTASPPFDVSTVTTSSYFIVPTPAATANLSSAKAAYDETVCDVSNALGATATCPMNWKCDLTPSSALSYETAYTICLTDGIAYENGSSFGGFMAQFTTAEASSAVTATLSPADGATSVALDTAVKAVFSAAITEPADWAVAFTLKLGGEGDSLCTSVTYDSTTLTATCAHAEFTRSSAYTAEASGVTDTTGAAVTTASATFSTAPTVTLLRLDGTALALTDMPIPRSATIKYTLATALTAEADRTAFEASVSVTDAAAVAGTYAWAADYLSTVFTPSSKLGYKTVYTITIDPSTMPVVLDLTKAVGTEMTFTTMTHRDIDGDGYADAVVGAQAAGPADEGQAYVFLGSATGIADCTIGGGCADTTITGETGGDLLGFSVSIAGDVNADGYEDVIVGAKGVGNNKGEAYILLGSATGIADCTIGGTCASLDATITGEADSNYLGYSVSTAGDVAGDGFDDVIVGAAGGAGGNGAAYVFLGSATGIADCTIGGTCTSLGATITGEAGSDELGNFVSIAGDVNGDGLDDVIVGADGVPGGAYNGAAYVFLGSATGIADCTIGGTCTSLGATITGEAGGDYLGVSLSTAGDVNGDGFDDVIVGAYGVPGWLFNGAAYVFLGSATGIADCTIGGICTSLGATIAGEVGSTLGMVSSAGDVDGDGYADIIAGATGAGAGQEGQAYVLMGSATGIGDCTIGGACTSLGTTITGATAGLYALGVSNQTLGDTDGDGYDDIVIGVPTFPDNGRAYIFNGSGSGIDDCDLSGICTANATITGAANGDALGYVQ